DAAGDDIGHDGGHARARRPEVTAAFAKANRMSAGPTDRRARPDPDRQTLTAQTFQTTGAIPPVPEDLIDREERA
ncbi:MAG: hypothetical protein ACTH1T_14540, partial [Brachybacterium tyrofermentans]